MLQPFTRLGLTGLCLFGLACTGAISRGDQSSSSGPGNAGPGKGNSSPGNSGGGAQDPAVTNPPNAVNPMGLPSDDATVPGVAPLRRLTKLEYRNTVRDLLGLDSLPDAQIDAFSADQDSAASGFLRGAAVTAAPDARGILQAAEELGKAALGRMGELLPCSPLPTAAAEQDACADEFIAGFGRRAYRRPLTDAEVDELKALYRAQRQMDIAADFTQAVANVVSAMLQSPYFLYRWELGPNAPIRDGDLIRFNEHEMASRLSYLFWASMPDDQLFEAADSGKLGTPDGVAAEARRLLASPKAGAALTDFHLQWLNMVGLEDMPKDASLSDYTPEVGKSMVKETEAFVASVYQGAQADGKFETLLTSNRSFADANLAKIYGLSNVSGTGMQPVELDPAQRAGLFTQGTFLATKADAIESHPIKRGDTALAHLLCIKLEIPADIDVPPLPEPMAGQTTRERVAQHSEAACATCHKLIDPLGFAFEHYDAIGKYRTEDAGKPVDASGTLSLGNATVTFKNAVELMPQLAKSEEARDCMATHWWRYAMRRQDLASEKPSLELVAEAFKQSGYDLREMLVALTRTRSFSHRKPSAGEVMP